MSEENLTSLCPECKKPIKEGWEVCPLCCTVLPDLADQEEKQQSQLVECSSETPTTERDVSPVSKEYESLHEFCKTMATALGYSTIEIPDRAKREDVLSESAKQGDPLAKMSLAVSYYREYCVGLRIDKKNVENIEKGAKAEKLAHEVIEEIKQLANHGNPDAMLSLGSAYYTGLVFEQDYTKAMEWYHKAAEAGDSRAMLCMGVMYQNGKGVTENNTEAMVSVQAELAKSSDFINNGTGRPFK